MNFTSIQMQQTLHKLEAAIRKQNEIARYYYRNSDYSRFLGYNNCVCHELTNKQWKNENIVDCTIPIV